MVAFIIRRQQLIFAIIKKQSHTVTAIEREVTLGEEIIHSLEKKFLNHTIKECFLDTCENKLNNKVLNHPVRIPN